MRPRGEIREALASAAVSLAAEHGSSTWLDMAHAAQVGAKVACKTVKNMVLAGELERRGERPVPGARRPMALYAPRDWSVGSLSPLDDVLRSWPRR
jgi:hypothetical protein